jgi:hypothetical protein
MAQQGLGREHLIKCGHASCSCVVEPGKAFCSDFCAKASPEATSYSLPGKRDTGECKCGHPDCKH